ncbi:Kazal-type serine protease inhibitor family protein [Emticicia fluvialis]|uniref:Kazal-type serine protease inhibitor family protein n=1 Tax=Emticicia fluvialis TaxID=2974474 RepID=UPI0021650C4E|nr:Kazal-type serine protease inhibitor [Emticicia fluvialis]
MAKIAFVALLLAGMACSKENSPEECVEKPNNGRVCDLVYNPVCGCNNKTYGNACDAEAHGITKYTLGKCTPPAPKGV